MRAFDWFLVAVQGLLLARWLFVLGSAVVQAVRRRPREAPGAVPQVSVVIPAYNEEECIGETVQSVAASDADLAEIVVVDDGSTDGTAAIVERLALAEPRLRLVRCEANQGKAAALNRGIAATSSPFVVTVDADTRLAPDTIRRLASAVSVPGAGAAACALGIANLSGALTRWQKVEYVAALNLDRRAQHAWGCITTVPGAAAAWRREAVEAAGGFSGSTCTEDMDLTLTLLEQGFRVELDERACALTLAPTGLRQLFRQRLRWLYGNLQCAWRHRRSLGSLDRPALGLLGLPNVWFVQLVAFLLLPFAVAATVRVAQLLGPWAAAIYTGLFALDVLACMLAFRFDGTRAPRVWTIASQRLLFPFLAWAVFLAACARWAGRRPVRWGER